MQAYAAHIGVMLECRWMESGMIGDGWGHADKVYHDTSHGPTSKQIGQLLMEIHTKSQDQLLFISLSKVGQSASNLAH